MFYYLGIEVKQLKDGIFITRVGYATETLKKFNMLKCKHVNTLMGVDQRSLSWMGQESAASTFQKSYWKLKILD